MFDNIEPVTITARAASEIRKIMDTKGIPEGYGLRVGVRGGGCSGLSYFLDTENAPLERDKVIDAHGVQVFVDPKSMLYLQGTTLDYVTGLMESGFKFINPRATKSCGCGESFSPA